MVSAKRQGERSCIPLLPERKKRGKLVHARRTEVYGWCTMERKQYFLVDADALPEIFTHVVTAKRLLADGKAASTSEAARMAGISRGAFYKYRDAVFPYTSVVERSILTVQAMLADQPGVLMAFVSAFYDMGANILTINQNIPAGGNAVVSISARTDSMPEPVETLIERLKAIRGVRSVDSISNQV